MKRDLRQDETILNKYQKPVVEMNVNKYQKPVVEMNVN